ncbi:MAG TPA: hypothetical protein VNN74_07300 [Candidatus Micrarchaeia archaeon]|nr:hypothetical protein [Candidatus Micrarchaeia archaeon]
MISQSPTGSSSRLQPGGLAHSPEEIARIPLVGTWLLVGANFFLLVPFFYAFFLLQSSNDNHAFKPHGVHPPSLAIGTIALALVLGSIALTSISVPRLRAQTTLSSFVASGWVGILLLVGAVVAQIWQLSHLGFGIVDGGFASVFVALSVFYTIEVGVLALWLISLTNRAGYESRHPIAVMDPQRSSVESPTPITALATSYLIFSCFLAAAGAISWVVLYFL